MPSAVASLTYLLFSHYISFAWVVSFKIFISKKCTHTGRMSCFERFSACVWWWWLALFRDILKILLCVFIIIICQLRLRFSFHYYRARNRSFPCLDTLLTARLICRQNISPPREISYYSHGLICACLASAWHFLPLFRLRRLKIHVAGIISFTFISGALPRYLKRYFSSLFQKKCYLYIGFFDYFCFLARFR